MKRLIRLIFCLLCLSLPGLAQDFIVDKHIGTDNGLSHCYVLDIAFDGQGFAWIATESGLNRIAGNTVTIYNKEAMTDHQGVAPESEYIRSLEYNPATEKMVIGMEKGFSIYDCRKGDFQNFIPKRGENYSGIADIASTDGKDVWLYYMNGTIQKLDCETLEQTTYRLCKYSGRCIFDDGNGHLYLGHRKDGMSVVSLNGNSSKHYAHQENDPSSIPGNNVRCIYMDKQKNVWVGTDHGLALFNPTTETFTKAVHSHSLYDDNVYDIKEMNNGMLWIASDMGGVSLLNLQQFGYSKEQSRQITYTENITVPLSSINTRVIEQDEFGNIWIGNHSTGIDFIPAKRNFFGILPYYDENRNIKRTYGISSDSKGHIWLGDEDEIALSIDNRIVKSWSIGARKNRINSFVMCMMTDSQDNLWLGIEDEGVVRFNPNSGVFERIDLGYSAPDIRSFYEDSEGTIWIGSEYGLFSYKNGVLSTEKEINERMNDDVVSGIVRLADGKMLLTTLARGLYLFEKGVEKPKRLDTHNGLPSPRINHIIADRDEGFWLATEEGLVHLKDVSHLENIEIFDKRHGLGNEHLCAVQQDRTGRIWVSTNTGIACLDRQKGRFYNYSHQRHLPSGGFIGASAATTYDGTMYFGSPNGVCFFNPQLINDEIKVSKVQIVVCDAYNPTGEDTEILHLLADDKGRVFTNYKQNTLRIAFTVEDFSEIDNVEYSYMMKGLNDQWYYIGNDNDVVFRGLKPGNYTFILRAKLKNQDWDEASVTQMEIRIAPPFWRTWWAYLIYFLLLTAAVWYLLRNYKHKLQLENRLAMEQRESQQKQKLNEERMRFFTNIAHELRTPLTLILGPLEDLVNDKRMPENYHRKVSLINTSAHRLGNLINDILDFRKVESQNKRLVVAKGNLGAHVREVGENFKLLNRNPKVQLHLLIVPGVPPVYFDSEIITTILNNFLSNAFKYTPEGSISLIMNADGQGRVSISVKDTGYGIAKDALPHIFDRYYQAEGKHQASGTGIGLSLVKSLADLHEGELSVESEQGVGSTFKFSLLMDNSYPGALHKDDTEETDKQEETSTDVAIQPIDNDLRPLLLVVEDNNDIRQYIAESMGEDYRIIQAADGIEGTMLAMEQVPDVIVSDIMMPKMNGIELTKRVKEDIRTSHIPVILLTAKDSVEDKEQGYDSGADSYLTKPFSAKLLQSRIQNLLNSRSRLAELIAFQNSGTGEQTAPVEQGGPTLNRLDQEFIDKMNKVIDENVTSEELNMEFMSDKMAMSYSTFYRKVKALTGQTAKEYIRKRRLQKSVELLRSGDYNVTEAATMTGFNDLNNFRIIFKKEFGVPPSEYMKK